MSRGQPTRCTRSVRVAAAQLRAGGVVAFPTETVYGLGAHAFDARAVRAIFRAKGRPADNPLIVHVADALMVERVARRVPVMARRLMDRFWPGPLTVIVPRHASVPDEVTAGLDTVGVRWPAHPVAQAFLQACAVPVAAPSANRSGRPSPTTWTAVVEEMSGRIPCILRGGPAEVGLESTVVDCTGRRPVVLRQGAITLEQVRSVVASAVVADHAAPGDAPVRSPGLKYRHYAPNAVVVLVRSAAEIPAGMTACGFIGTSARGLTAKLDRTALVPGVPAYAHRLFQFFRVCERAGVRTIYCQTVSERGLGRALMDRLRRAASGHPTPPSGGGTVHD